MVDRLPIPESTPKKSTAPAASKAAAAVSSEPKKLPIPDSSQYMQSASGIKAATEQSLTYAAIAYVGVLVPLIGFLVPLIMYFVAQKDDKFARFHALQSFVMTLALFVIAMVVAVPMYLLMLLVGLVFLALYIYLAFMAYKGGAFKVPVIGDLVMAYA